MTTPPTQAEVASHRVVVVEMVLVALVYLALALPGAERRGIIAEEVQPYLPQYPVVLEWQRGLPRPEPGAPDLRPIVAMPPYDAGADVGATPRERWVATSQWPVIAYLGEDRMYPVFVRGHQTALGSYPGILLGPVLGGGIAGVRRVNVLMGLGILLLTHALARRIGRGPPLLAGMLLATSYGLISIAQTGYGFELSSRLLFTAAVVLAATARPLSRSGAAWVGIVAGTALVARGPIVIALAPALAMLLLPRARRSGRQALAITSVLALGIPLVVVALAAALVPFRDGEEPLSNFRVVDIPAHLLGAPRQVALTLAWLADATTAVFRPLHGGRMSFEAIAAPAAVAAVPLIAGLVRWWRGVETEAERLFLTTAGATMLGAAILYDDPNQFQLSMALEPLFVVAVADQIAALRVRAGARVAAVATAIACVVRVQGALSGVLLPSASSNPMLSGLAQRAAVERLEELGVRGPELLTTVYNQAGVIEGWTWGDIRPVHAWPLLSFSHGTTEEVDAAVRALLVQRRPRYVLVTEGRNVFESGAMDPTVIATAFERIGAERGLVVERAGTFPTESGAPGWALLSVREATRR